ncbi:MAG: cytochrome c oxidase subunit [Acidobacteriota bacterium]|jgi:cytochrome c oxidase subunit 2|nr:cytochrome c oxidase subunit [Acidobacteriota bacterium]
MSGISAAACLLLFAGHPPAHSALASAGPQAARIESLWWLFFWVCSAVFLLVMAALAVGLVRDRTPEEAGAAPGPIPPEARRRRTRVVAVATAITALILFVFLFASTGTGRAIASLSRSDRSDAMTVEVTGHQWWWEVQYIDPVPGQRVTTANEIHIPVGRPVRIRTASHDVIHSFWVPSLHGKRDLIPGHDSEDFWLQADRPGVYRGQCAEFCGHQHAHMAFLVIADPPDRFAAWLDAQRQPAATPATPQALRGQDLFVHLQCALCHAVEGTDAGGRVGPDLTHVASRRTLAAATLPNTRGHLSDWIVDSQRIKPGNPMPPTRLAGEDLESILAYLESLK